MVVHILLWCMLQIPTHCLHPCPDCEVVSGLLCSKLLPKQPLRNIFWGGATVPPGSHPSLDQVLP